MDSYVEYIVKKKKDIKDVLVTILAGVFAFFFTFLVLSIPVLIAYPAIQFWLVIGAWYVAYRVLVSRNLEFEYTVTSGELDIDKIINMKRRKRVLSVDAKAFEIFEPVSEAFLARVKNMSGIKVVHAEGDMKSNAVYGAIFNDKGVKTCLFIQPSERILEAIARRRR